MPVTVEEDLVKDAHFSVNRDGRKMDRVFLIGGLTPGSDTLYQASIAVDAVTGVRVPQYGQAHESIPGIWCSNVDIKPFAEYGRTSARAVTTYDWNVANFSGQSMANITCTSQTIDVNNDGKGNSLVVTYKDVDGKTYTNYAPIKAQIVHAVLEFKRIESVSPLRRINYTGATNTDSFQGQDPYTWLCRQYGGQAIGGGSWLMTFVAEWFPEGLIQLNWFRDPVTNVIPPDALKTVIDPKNIPAGGIGGQVANGVYAYRPKPLPFAALNIPNLT